ncbi:MAG: hypothetical protein WAO35_06420 [Terriglobia bacterium]
MKSRLLFPGKRQDAVKLSRAEAAGAACVCLLPGALAVLGFAHLCSLVAKAQIVDTSGQSYYANAKPLLDYPLPDILKAAPELQGLEPAANQDELASILDKTGEVTEDLLGSMPNLISREDIIQAKLGDPANANDQRRLVYDYLILVHRQGTNITLEEYRSGPGGTGTEAQSLDEGYMITRGFASFWLHFHPSNRLAARFHYLGQQTDSGLKCYVVAFAQKPGWATVTGTVVYKGVSLRILYQGIAWIDEASFRIVRLRTDLLAPRPAIGLERMTTELHFGETRLPQTAAPLWLPQEVVVTTERDKHSYQNVHRYSDYRLFKVETKILPTPPDSPLPTKPN